VTGCQIDPDNWLANLIGSKALRISVHGQVDAAQLERRLSTEFGSGAGFAYAKIPMVDVPAIEVFSRLGFYAVDTSVTFQRGDEPHPDRAMPDGIEVRRADTAECEAAREIAGRCMVFSRFHVDPRFGSGVGDAVNRAWMQSYCDGNRGEETQVALLGGRVVGFNAILRSSVAGAPCRVVDLIGVDDEARGRGIGQALMRRFIADTLTAGVRCMRVTTQASNIAAVNLYERSGFRLTESLLVMHRHVG
jgi:dTDP-4-amino-4,6-dideoxy-D-galactose acyltransferase